ncbi:HlyD family secretion protein [Rhizobium viscosum]|uniref:RND family efflux transporter MFP subunit n=2 Tax=Rhizobium viscosum TaxID=1673 RepID=A0ABR9ITS6_RHIVS|nr:efflux RND transporter periplasmic adaptor subunit [Rhizobium viscosum]MBE1506611.1 RND family efflux transporter MFP subunit [Rhizobium viscosum]
MIVVLLNVYLVILFLLVKLNIIRFSLFWKISPVLVFLFLLVGLFIPMGWGAPQGNALVVRNSVAIVPNVAGEVTDVPVKANTPLKAGDTLFKIDPQPYQAKLDALKAQLGLNQQRLEETTRLQTTGAGRAYDVEQRQAEVEQLTAEIAGAAWDLDKTVVRAPADGYVTNLALRAGARVSSLPLAPVMAFIDTADTIIGVEIAQINARYVEPGQAVEITFKFAPGRIFTGKVETVIQAVATGQVQTSGSAVAPSGILTAPLVVRVRLDDQAFAASLPAGSTGTAAIFTDHVKSTHIIRRVVLRQVAIMNYINPF